MMVLKDDNSNNRIDILGITTDDLYVLKLGLKCLIKDNAEVNKNRVYELMEGLNDELKFFETNSDSFPVYDKHKVNGQPFVDLGLPSGLLWATCNVGAESPEQAGLYFAWGETTGFTAEQVKEGLRKFNKPSYKAIKIKADLTPEQDAAHANMGGDWRMPTKVEFQELIDNCISERIEDFNGTGVAGYLFTSKTNGNSVFFPAAGHCGNSSVLRLGLWSYYWSASWISSSYAWDLYFFYGRANTNGSRRYFGQPVRGVCER